MLSSLQGHPAQSLHFNEAQSHHPRNRETGVSVDGHCRQLYAEIWAISVTDCPAALVSSIFCVMQKHLSRIIGTQFDLFSPGFLQSL